MAELQMRMSSREFSEWMAFYGLEPFGDEWRQTGLVASVVAETNRDPDTKTDPFIPEDFMPELSSDEMIVSDEDDMSYEPTWKKIKATMSALANRGK